jgi:nicotinate-nucleotide adenylyltransferase
VSQSTSRPPRIGFFGGSFDPPHSGHLALASLALQTLDLDSVLVAPVGRQPLKLGQQATPFRDRIAMTRLALAGHPRLQLSEADAPLPGGQPNYMIDTLHRLQANLPPGTQLYVICGTDAFLHITLWHRASDLLIEFPFIIGARPGFELGRIANALPDDISVASDDQPDPHLLTLGLRDTQQRRSRLYLLPELQHDVSATEIRDALRSADPTPALLPPAVLAYIREHRLYGHSNGN